MNISNTISHDSSYGKNDLLDRKIQQSIPEVKNQGNFSQQLDRLDSLDEKEELKSIEEAIKESNRKLQLFDRKLDISIHDKTSRIMVKVIDTANDKIIREIPPENVLDNMANIKEMLGFMVDKKI